MANQALLTLTLNNNFSEGVQGIEDGIRIEITNAFGATTYEMNPAINITNLGDFQVANNAINTAIAIAHAWNRDYRSTTGVQAESLDEDPGLASIVRFSLVDTTDFTTRLSGSHNAPPQIIIVATEPVAPITFAITGITIQQSDTEANRCSHVRYNIAVEDGVAPYQIVSPVSKTNLQEADLFFEQTRQAGGTVTVRDANGDEATATIPQVKTFSITNIDVSSGFPVLVNIFAATAGDGNDLDLTYSVDGTNYQTSRSFSLTTDDRIGYVRDNYGCTQQMAFTVPFTITSLTVSTAEVNAPCTHVKRTATVTSGTPPYQITSPVQKTAETEADLFFEYQRQVQTATESMVIQDSTGAEASIFLENVASFICSIVKSSVLTHPNSSLIEYVYIPVLRDENLLVSPNVSPSMLYCTEGTMVLESIALPSTLTDAAPPSA